MSAGIIILFVTIPIMIIVVRIGGIALELTGLESAVARFQALSAFTRTGFTTREAEEVVHHPQRRRIVSMLILLGSAGLITIIAGLLETFKGAFAGEESNAVWLPFAQLAGAGVILYLLYRVFIWPRLAQRIDQAIRSQLKQRSSLSPAEIEELLHSAEGWAIARVEVPEGCQFADKTLAESRPRDKGILVIAIERNGKFIPSPTGEQAIIVGDRLIVYGQLAEMPQLLGTQSRSAETGGA